MRAAIHVLCELCFGPCFIQKVESDLISSIVLMFWGCFFIDTTALVFQVFAEHLLHSALLTGCGRPKAVVNQAVSPSVLRCRMDKGRTRHPAWALSIFCPITCSSPGPQGNLLSPRSLHTGIAERYPVTLAALFWNIY